ncbi:MAG: DUF4136 domain-containing protein [Pseudomonadota bacterium]
MINKNILKAVFLICCIGLVFVACMTTGGAGHSKTAVDPKTQYKTEADLMLTLANYTSDPASQDFPVVFPTEAINIKAYRDNEEPLASFNTYNFDYTNKANPLLEKELFGQLEKVLQKHGFTRNQKNPQIVISMNFFLGKREQYTPPATVTNTEIKSVWNTGFVGWSAAGFSSQVPVTTSTTTPGYTTISYYTNIRLNFLNRARLTKAAKLETPPIIWLGEADTEGYNSDIRSVAPVMFNELIEEFPAQSPQAPVRFVRHFRYGWLGLGFAPDNWRVIRYVEPNSPAAEKGIKIGDTLVKINGEGVGTFVPQSLWYIPNSDNYRVSDPYYQYVLSSRGDNDVTVTIKSAGTGEKVDIQLRPRSGDRYIDVNQYGSPIH